MVVVFRGTETEAEWTENATMTMTQLEGTEQEHGLGLIFNRQVSTYHWYYYCVTVSYAYMTHLTYGFCLLLMCMAPVGRTAWLF